MKLSFIGLCAVGAAAILFQIGATAPVSMAAAKAEGCIVTDVTLHVKRCPAGAKLSTHAGGGLVAPPAVKVTPTAGAPEGCIKTNVAKHVRRCPAGV